MPVTQVSASTRNQSSAGVAGAALAHSTVGTLIAGMVITLMLRLPGQASLPELHVVRAVADSAFLFGLATGALATARLTGILSPASLWSTAIGTASLGMVALGFVSSSAFPASGMLTPALRLLTGSATAVAWISGEAAICSSVPNYRRWQVTGILSVAFLTWGVVLALLQTAQWVELPGSPATFLAGIWIVLGGGSFVLIRTFFRQLPRPAGQTSQSYAEVAETAVSCETEHCCGGAVEQRPAPLSAGIIICCCGLLLLCGPLLDLWFSAIGVGRSTSTGYVWLLGFSQLAGVVGYRLIMGQAGNILTLPITMLTATCALILLYVPTVGSGLWMIGALPAAAAVAGSVQGCISMVGEYFRDAPGGNRRTAAFSFGAAAAGVLLLITSLAGSQLLPVGLFVIQPLFLAAAMIGALRAIPQPILVTRFAERFLNQPARSS